MAEVKEFTFSEVSKHTSKKDLYLIVHDKVYNSSSFVDEHPYVRSLSATSSDPYTLWARRRSISESGARQLLSRTRMAQSAT